MWIYRLSLFCASSRRVGVAKCVPEEGRNISGAINVLTCHASSDRAIFSGMGRAQKRTTDGHSLVIVRPIIGPEPMQLYYCYIFLLSSAKRHS